MAAGNVISCKQFASFLVSQEPVYDKEVLKGINLRVPVGETHILFGKNGSGKSSLLMSIMGFERYQVKQGRISFLGQDITQLPIYERARLGLGLSFQRPPTIRGVKTADVLRVCSRGAIVPEVLAAAYDFTQFLDREVNYGFLLVSEKEDWIQENITCISCYEIKLVLKFSED